MLDSEFAKAMARHDVVFGFAEGEDEQNGRLVVAFLDMSTRMRDHAAGCPACSFRADGTVAVCDDGRVAHDAAKCPAGGCGLCYGEADPLDTGGWSA